MPDPIDIFKTLRVPDAIKDLPTFDGNPRTLYEFINNVEELLAVIAGIDGTTQGKIILMAIRNKIIGKANEILNMYGTPLNWEAIRANLITHYADKRNETSLIRDLHQLRQNSDSVELFYSKVIEILSTINNHVKIHEAEETVIRAKQILYEEMCLNSFLSGLRDPLGATVRAMQPTNLAESFSYCLKEQNTSYFKSNSYPKHLPPVKVYQPPNQVFGNQNFRPSNYQPQPNGGPANFNNPRMYLRNTSQTNKFNRPEPMDTSSGNTIVNRPIRFTLPFNNNSNHRPKFQPNNFSRPNFNSFSRPNFNGFPRPNFNTPSSSNNFSRVNNYNNSNATPKYVAEELFNLNSNLTNTDDDTVQLDDSGIQKVEHVYSNPVEEQNYYPSLDQNECFETEPVIDDADFHLHTPRKPNRICRDA